MTWYATSRLPVQYTDLNGVPYSGAVLKAYAESSATSIPMATNYLGTTTVSSISLNSYGYPSHSGAVVIPHVQEDCKFKLFPDQASADSDTGEVWVCDNIKVAESIGNTVVDVFSGDGVTDTFTLSEDMGDDPSVLMVFADRKFEEYATDGGFSDATKWTVPSNWSVTGGAAVASSPSSNLSQVSAIPLVQYEAYMVTYKITAYTSGSVKVSLGGVTGTARSATGTFSEIIVCGSTQNIEFVPTSSVLSIDDLSIHKIASVRKEIHLPSELDLSGVTLKFDKAPAAGTSNIVVFSMSGLVGALTGYADAAALSETAAAASAASALLSETNAATSETNASNYAMAAQNYAIALSGTSTTSLTIGTGSQTLTTQASKQWVPGQRLRIASDDGTKVMDGEVTSYSTTSLVLDVDYVEGSGTHADWNISIVGERGATGATGPTGAGLTAADISGQETGTPADTDVYVFERGDSLFKSALSAIFTLFKGTLNVFTKPQIPSETALTSTSSHIAIDLSLSNDFYHTFTENTTLDNPTNIVAGQSGAIRFTQHASSPKTLAFGSYWDFAGGTAPAVTATNSARDTLFYHVRDTTHIEASLVKNWS